MIILEIQQKSAKMKIPTEEDEELNLIYKYYSLFLETFGENIEIIFKDERVKAQILAFFHTLTPNILTEIQKLHRIEEEIQGKKFSDSLIPKPIDYTNFR